MEPGLVNLTFHGIGSCPRPLDAGERDVWLGTDELDAVLDRVTDDGAVRITFDDGNASDVEHALPALRDRGLRATFFVVAGRLGEPGFLGRDGVRELAAAGMGIGCHGMEHRPWRGLAPPDLDRELVGAKAMLEELLGAPVRDAACPFGAYDRRALAALRGAGYERVYTSDGGRADGRAWLQPRNTLRRGGGAAQLDGVGDERPAGALLRRAKTAVKRWR